MTENKKEPIRLEIEDVILNLILLLWPSCSVKRATLEGRTFRHTCKKRGNWVDWSKEVCYEDPPIRDNQDVLPIYYFLLKGGRKIAVRHCYCNRCMTIWFDYTILKEVSS